MIKECFIKASLEEKQLSAKDLCALAVTSLDDDKAEDVVVIELKGKSDIADYMIIATGRSDRHVSSIAEHLNKKMHQNGVVSVNMEGQREGNWVLVDADQVIIHIFKAEVRAYYSLEKMWAVEIPVEA